MEKIKTALLRLLSLLLSLIACLITAIKSFLGYMFWVTGILIVLYIFALPHVWLSRSEKPLPLWLQISILILWGTCLVVFIWALVFKKNRTKLFDKLRKVGAYTPSPNHRLPGGWLQTHTFPVTLVETEIFC